MPDLSQFVNDLSRVGLLVVAVQLLLIILATLIALRFAHITVSVALRRLFHRETTEGTARDLSAVEVQRRQQTLDSLLYRALRLIVLIIAFLMALFDGRRAAA